MFISCFVVINDGRDRPNFSFFFVFGGEHEDFWWFIPVSFSAENAFFCLVWFSFLAQNVIFSRKLE